MNIERIVAHYGKLKEQKAQLDQQHKEAVAPVKEKMATIEAAMQKYLQDNGMQSVKTSAGTPYLSETQTVQVEDWEALSAHLSETAAWADAVERRVNKAWLKEQEGQVPGVHLSTMIKCNIRRS